MPTYASHLQTVTQLAVSALRTALAGAPIQGRVYSQAPPTLSWPLVTVVVSERVAIESETGESAQCEIVATTYSAQAGVAEVDQVATTVVSTLTADATWATVPGAMARFVAHERPGLVEIEGQILTARESLVSVWIPV